VMATNLWPGPLPRSVGVVRDEFEARALHPYTDGDDAAAGVELDRCAFGIAVGRADGHVPAQGAASVVCIGLPGVVVDIAVPVRQRRTALGRSAPRLTGGPGPGPPAGTWAGSARACWAR